MQGLELAERTGLEPATPGVTGRYSNQLNYRSDCGQVAADGWGSRQGANPNDCPSGHQGISRFGAVSVPPPGGARAYAQGMAALA